MEKLTGNYLVQPLDQAQHLETGQSNTNLTGAAIAAAGAAAKCQCVMRITTPRGQTCDVAPGESHEAVANRLRVLEGAPTEDGP